MSYVKNEIATLLGGQKTKHKTRKLWKKWEANLYKLQMLQTKVE